MARSRNRPLNKTEIAIIHALFKHVHHNTGAAVNFGMFQTLSEKISATTQWYGEFGIQCEVIIGPWHDDDAGVIKTTRPDGTITYDVIKMESHCSPSAVTPFDSAATGVGGASRDVVAMGGIPLYVTDFIGTLPLEEEIVIGPCALVGDGRTCHCGKCQTQMSSAYRVQLMQEGMVTMCHALGLQVPAGGFSTSFKNCLVPAVVVTVGGILIAEQPVTKVAKNVGDKIIFIGKTGPDGNDTSYRAGFAEEEGMLPAKALFSEELVSMQGAIAAHRTNLVQACADFGAAGAAAAVCESVRKGGLGAIVDLSLVRLMGEINIAPQSILLNETQARYLLQVRPEHVDIVLSAIRSRGAFAEVVGEITDGQESIFMYGDEEIAVIPNEPSAADMEEVAKATAA